MFKIKGIFLLMVITLLIACQQPKNNGSDAQKFIDIYTEQYVKLYINSAVAQWKSNTEIKQGDSAHTLAARKADEAMAAFTGKQENITRAKKYLSDAKTLTDIQKKQLELILYAAANNPQTIADVVKQRIKAENDQVQKLYGYEYLLHGKKLTTNDLDDILKNETSLSKRLDAWNASKAIGPELKNGLVKLRSLRNRTVQELGYPDYFSYQVSDYGMKTEEMMKLMDDAMSDLWPLYRELHTWMRYEMAKRYKVTEVPKMLPAHWLPNRWGQDWSSILTVKGMDMEEVFQRKGPEWMVREAEKLYVSLGFEKLPESFWLKSSLYPYPVESRVKKNNHASAWHMDLNQDVRCLMSVEPNAQWFQTVNHELGHIYYYLSYANKDVPPLLRQGANRAYHEAIGSMMGLAAMQKPYLVGRGLVGRDVKTDSVQMLLKEALSALPFIFFSSGTMSKFEKNLYVNNLPRDKFNITWWSLARKYQGIEPPALRGEEWCDAVTKTHINDDPGQYYDYALSYIILYQLHNHIAKNILHQNPRATNYFGQKEVGDFVKKILKYGASKDWRTVLKESTGDELNAKGMLNYFQPLTAWLKAQNKNRVYTLPVTL